MTSNTKRPRTGTLIPFPGLEEPAGDGATDATWTRIETLYRELASMDPRFWQRLQQRFEQAFSSVLARLIDGWDLQTRARFITLAQKILIRDSDECRRQAQERIAKGIPTWLDEDFTSKRPTYDQEVEDLVIQLERERDDRRRESRRQTGGAR